MDRNKARAYTGIAIETLYKAHEPMNPKNILRQLDITFELYDENEVEGYYNKQLEDNIKNDTDEIEGLAISYIVNIFDTSIQQKRLIEKFCRDSNIDLRRIYVTSPGKNTDNYYRLIKEIRAKAFNVLIVTVFSIYAIPEEEWSVIVKLCRQNDINIIEI